MAAALNGVVFSMVLALLALSAPLAFVAGDPDILTDYIVPLSVIPGNITGGAFFTYTGLRAAVTSTAPANFTVTKASMAARPSTGRTGHYTALAEFPALNGQSVSFAALSYPPGSVNPVHTHPRASELLLVIDGALSVGFVDTAGKLFAQDLATGDMFVFPKGTVHWQCNKGNQPARALSAFGSAAAGLVSVPVTVFGTGIDDTVLAKSFKTDVDTVQKLKAALTPTKKP
ncbi:unnamed protein product [Urochloa decumbens]|uniref:Germin-like protein n=1 Tax=Urochloa decumbens TaxID=240449 RepID=A0ABC9EYK2_9POAL